MRDLLALLGLVEDFGIGWRTALQRLLRADRRVDHAELELGGLAEEVDQAPRIAEAQHLHQDTVRALALDGRLDEAQFVDALLDDPDRLVDGLTDAFDHRGIARRQADESAAGVDHFESALAIALDRFTPPSGCDSSRQLRQPALEIATLAQPHLDAVAAHHRRGRPADAGIAQRAAHLVAQIVEALLAHVVQVDLEQDVRAALQIEAEHEAPLRPGRPGLGHRLGEEIRNRKAAHHRCREQNGDDLPTREI